MQVPHLNDIERPRDKPLLPGSLAENCWEACRKSIAHLTVKRGSATVTAMGIFSKKKKPSGPFQFRVSDSVQVPLRGYLLRLKLLDGTPGLADVSPGRRIRVRSPNGTERVITIKDFSATAGFPSQEKLEQQRELDIVVDTQDAIVDGREIEIGWIASGPVED